jgi:pyruvate dehydrogenase E1 component alpha subunit
MEMDEGAPSAPGGGAVATPLDRASALAVLATMWRIRCFEERVGVLKRADEVYGLIHLSIGGEGVAAAVCSQLRDDDPAYTGHRGHGHAIAKGAPLARTMAELMGRSDGLCRGFGGSMHLVDLEHGLMGATGVVGGNVPLALGSALASRLRGSDAVAVVFFGDGAVQAGHFNESVNLAALWALPVILVCENNGMAEFTSREEHSVIERVSDVVAPYEVVRETVDGSDVGAVWDAFGRNLSAARRGEGPFLLECLTHRLRGHYEGDPTQYREAIAAEEWQQRDPILRLERTAAAAGWFGEPEAAAAAADARAEVEAAVEFARASPYPDIGLLEQLVYAP